MSVVGILVVCVVSVVVVVGLCGVLVWFEDC